MTPSFSSVSWSRNPPQTHKLNHVSGRAAALKVDDAGHIRMRLPVLGTVRLPEPQRLTYYAAVGALGVLGVLEWPVAFVLAGGHALAADQHNRAAHQFGEALEDA